MKVIFSLVVSFVMLFAALPGTTMADTKKPDSRHWECTTVGGTRTCHRRGERCTLVVSKAGKYWVCDGPVTTSRRRIWVSRRPNRTNMTNR